MNSVSKLNPKDLCKEKIIKDFTSSFVQEVNKMINEYGKDKLLVIAKGEKN